MEYRLSVNPNKIEEFLQLLRAWKKLGIIEDFQLAEPTPDETNLPIWAGSDNSAEELTKQYRDLVD